VLHCGAFKKYKTTIHKVYIQTELVCSTMYNVLINNNNNNDNNHSSSNSNNNNNMVYVYHLTTLSVALISIKLVSASPLV
jgi:hypothetical protein